MNKRINKLWQSLLLVTIAVVFMLAANSPASAQTGNYKVGDRVEVMSAGDWIEAEILKITDTGEYIVRIIKYDISGASYDAKGMRPIKAKAQTNNQNNAGNQAQDQTNGNAQATNGGATAATQQEKSIRGRYGSREPRTCADQKAPARGAITAELAKKYFICKAEGISGNLLYLVENVSSVEVGGGVPYHPTLGAFEAINVRVPLYPIRGSYLRYQCKNLINEHVGPPDTNCNTYNQPKATGYCYKTTFGDWSCYMSDGSNKDEDWRRGVAPPK